MAARTSEAPEDLDPLDDPDLAPFLLADERYRRGCQISGFDLSPQRQEALTKAMAMPVDKVSHSRVVEVLKGWGIKTSVRVVGNHRRGQCSCEAKAKADAFLQGRDG